MARWWGLLVLAAVSGSLGSGCAARPVARSAASPTIGRRTGTGDGQVRRVPVEGGLPVRFASPPGHELTDRTHYRFVGAQLHDQLLVECRPGGGGDPAEGDRRRSRVEAAGGRIETDEPLVAGSAAVPHLAFVIDERRGATTTRVRVHWAFPELATPGCQPFLSLSAPANETTDAELLRSVLASLAPSGEPPPAQTPEGYQRWQAGPVELDVPTGFRLAESRRYVYESEDGRTALALLVGPRGGDDEDVGVPLDEAEVVARREVLVAGRATFEVDYRLVPDEGAEPLLVRVAEIALGRGLRLAVWARAPAAEAEHLERLWTQLLASIVVPRG